MLYLLLLCQMCDIISVSSGNALAKTGATHYQTQLGLPDKGHTIKGLEHLNMQSTTMIEK